jgi:hypothetical protein
MAHVSSSVPRAARSVMSRHVLLAKSTFTCSPITLAQHAAMPPTVQPAIPPTTLSAQAATLAFSFFKGIACPVRAIAQPAAPSHSASPCSVPPALPSSALLPSTTPPLPAIPAATPAQPSTPLSAAPASAATISTPQLPLLRPATAYPANLTAIAPPARQLTLPFVHRATLGPFLAHKIYAFNAYFLVPLVVTGRPATALPARSVIFFLAVSAYLLLLSILRTLLPCRTVQMPRYIMIRRVTLSMFAHFASKDTPKPDTAAPPACWAA